MDTERWQRVEQLCHAALERDPGEQPAFLDEACAGDEALRREVESLLAHQTQEVHFLEASALAVAAEALARDESYQSAQAPRLIGRLLSDYRIVEKLGLGGMGEVYRAIRADGTYDKQVAIKLVQSGLSTDYFLARFKNERQILASLDHPNIARLIDGGSTEEGLPYVVMEYIEGQPIDEYCEQCALDIPGRLRLFRNVCSAVQYAHKNLVVHRDLKPANVLVTQEGIPKLLDFGIAKILQPQDEVQQGTRTETLLPLMTPDYASPEQIRGKAITTSTDVYSLGLILYFLLTGQHPHKSDRTGPHEVMKAICDEEPKKPSTAVARRIPTHVKNIAAADASDGTQSDHERIKPRRALAGDLDNIALKALQKEPERRYASVEQFSEDIRRHLAGLPVVAHADTAGYRARKFVRRHKFGVGAVALLILSLVAGLVATLREARIARFQRVRAERRFNDVRALANSLMFDINDSMQGVPGATGARRLLVSKALQYLDGLAGEAAGDPSLQRELATAYLRVGEIQGLLNQQQNLGNTSEALDSYRKAVRIRESLLAAAPNDSAAKNDLAFVYRNLAELLALRNDLAGALEYDRKTLSLYQELHAANSTDDTLSRRLAAAYYGIARHLSFNAEWAPASQNIANALAIVEPLWQAKPTDKVLSLTLGPILREACWEFEKIGDPAKALDLSNEAVSLSEKLASTYPEDVRTHFEQLVSYGGLGRILADQGNLVGSLKNWRKALEIGEALAAVDTKDVRTQVTLPWVYNNVGLVLAKTGGTGSLYYEIKGLEINKKLYSADPANKGREEAIANSYGTLGDTEVVFASRPNLALSARLHHYREAGVWYKLALQTYSSLQSEGSLRGEDGGEPERVKNELTKCESDLARLAPAIPTKREHGL